MGSAIASPSVVRQQISRFRNTAKMSISRISKTINTENDYKIYTSERKMNHEGKNYNKLVIKLGAETELRILDNQISEFKGKFVHEKSVHKQNHQFKLNKSNELRTASDPFTDINGNMQTKKRIALVAHDRYKQRHMELSQHQLMGTGTTARRIVEETSLPVE